MNNDVLVRVDGVSKKFCRTLKRSLWYGIQDIGRELTGRDASSADLRPSEFWAVDDVSFELRRGECLGLIGPNGAGKSTLLKMLNGLIKLDRGRIEMHGRVGALIELGAGFNPILTGRENIYVNAAVLGLSKKETDEKLESIIDFAEIGDFIDAPVQSYSSGMRVRLGFAVAAHLDPDIFLVDEVLAVGDVAFRMKCFQHILDLKSNGCSIIVVSHNMIDVGRVCDRATVVDSGSAIFNGDIEEGICVYEESVHGRGITPRSTDVDAEVPAWFESVEVTDLEGRPAASFHTGDSACLFINIGCNQPTEGARVLLKVESTSSGLLGGFAIPIAEEFPTLTIPRSRLRVVLPDMPLLLGSYNIILHLYGPNISDYWHSLKRAATIRIVGPPIDNLGFGRNHAISFSYEWSRVS